MMDHYRVIIEPRASHDIVAICEFIEKSSPQNASSVAKSLFEAIDSLEILPHRCKVHQFRQNPAMIVLSMSVPPFIIYYRIRERESLVKILTVRHGARRPPGRLD
jgi:plasmid stabilization system protein ParE